MSAQGIEDLSLMCALPSFTVIVPADGPEAALAVRKAAESYGPFYIRLSRPATPVVHEGDYDFKIGQAELLRDGGDATIIACGTMVKMALTAAQTLDSEGIQCRVLNMATLQPVDAEAIASAARETGAIVTAEEHLRHGGLGSIVAQAIGESCPVPMRMVTLHRYAESGSPDQLLEKYGLTPSNVAEAVRQAVQHKARLSANGRPAS